MNEQRRRKSAAREDLAASGEKQYLRSQRFQSFIASWAKRHMPERVKRFSVRT